jgi:hypothetical protein
MSWRANSQARQPEKTMTTKKNKKAVARSLRQFLEQQRRAREQLDQRVQARIERLRGGAS